MPVKRRAIQLTVLVLLGAIVNVAVAWGVAVLADPNSGKVRNGLSNIDGLHWSVEHWESSGRSRYESTVWAGFASKYQHEGPAEDLIPRWGRITKPTPPKQQFWTDPKTGRVMTLAPTGFTTMIDEAFGWPMLALWCGWGTPSLSTNLGVSPLKADEWSIIVTPRRALPLRPFWPGFAINTIFYAAILWVVWFVPGNLKRSLRRSRGLCPVCAYPVGTSPVCTECGTPIKQLAISGQQSAEVQS